MDNYKEKYLKYKKKYLVKKKNLYGGLKSRGNYTNISMLLSNEIKKKILLNNFELELMRLFFTNNELELISKKFNIENMVGGMYNGEDIEMYNSEDMNNGEDMDIDSKEDNYRKDNKRKLLDIEKNEEEQEDKKQKGELNIEEEDSDSDVGEYYDELEELSCSVCKLNLGDKEEEIDNKRRIYEGLGLTEDMILVQSHLKKVFQDFKKGEGILVKIMEYAKYIEETKPLIGWAEVSQLDKEKEDKFIEWLEKTGIKDLMNKFREKKDYLSVEEKEEMDICTEFVGQIVRIKKKQIKKQKSGRKKTETEVCELVCAIGLGLKVAHKREKYIGIGLDLSELENLEKCGKELIALNILVCDDIDSYIKDGIGKELIIKQHLDVLRNEMFGLDCVDFDKLIDNIREKGIIVSGKIVKKEEHSLLIAEAHKDLQTKEAKADVHIIFKKTLGEIVPGKFKNEDSQILGISVKQIEDCTKANYSVQKLIGELGGPMKELVEVKKKFLGELYVSLSGKSDEEKKLIRDKCGDMLRPYTHGKVGDPTYIPDDMSHYYDRLKFEIQNGEMFEKIKLTLVGLIFSEKTPYDNYEITNTGFYKLTKTNEELEEIKRNCRLEPWKERYYFTKGQNAGLLNDSAKLFYKLTLEKVGVFKVEVRHKGEFTSSPQFQVIKTCEMIVIKFD